MKTFEEIFQEHEHFVETTFTNATAGAAIIHLKTEIKELEEELYDEVGCNPDKLLIEYADCILCAISSAVLSGYFTMDELREAIEKKVQINKARTWKLNPDNTYSHVK